MQRPVRSTLPRLLLEWNDRPQITRGADCLEHTDAARPGHSHIQNGDIRIFARDRCQRGVSIIDRSRYFQSRIAHNCFHAGTEKRMVICNQHAHCD